jgi:hypothetical protein
MIFLNLLVSVLAVVETE